MPERDIDLEVMFDKTLSLWEKGLLLLMTSWKLRAGVFNTEEVTWYALTSKESVSHHMYTLTRPKFSYGKLLQSDKYGNSFFYFVSTRDPKFPFVKENLKEYTLEEIGLLWYLYAKLQLKWEVWDFNVKTIQEKNRDTLKEIGIALERLEHKGILESYDWGKYTNYKIKDMSIFK